MQCIEERLRIVMLQAAQDVLFFRGLDNEPPPEKPAAKGEVSNLAVRDQARVLPRRETKTVGCARRVARRRPSQKYREESPRPELGAIPVRRCRVQPRGLRAGGVRDKVANPLGSTCQPISTAEGSAEACDVAWHFGTTTAQGVEIPANFLARSERVRRELCPRPAEARSWGRIPVSALYREVQEAGYEEEAKQEEPYQPAPARTTTRPARISAVGVRADQLSRHACSTDAISGRELAAVPGGRHAARVATRSLSRLLIDASSQVRPPRSESFRGLRCGLDARSARRVDLRGGVRASRVEHAVDVPGEDRATTHNHVVPRCELARVCCRVGSPSRRAS